MAYYRIPYCSIRLTRTSDESGIVAIVTGINNQVKVKHGSIEKHKWAQSGKQKKI